MGLVQYSFYISLKQHVLLHIVYQPLNVKNISQLVHLHFARINRQVDTFRYRLIKNDYKTFE